MVKHINLAVIKRQRQALLKLQRQQKKIQRSGEVVEVDFHFEMLARMERPRNHEPDISENSFSDDVDEMEQWSEQFTQVC
jgi:hypothetical protein